MTSTNEIGPESERVQCAAQTDLNELLCSTICANILWKPVACQECETHFCSTCIGKWLSKNPNQCPMRCESFIRRPCSKFIARQLAKLKVFCIYKPNGCNEIIPYEALDKHEMACEYQYVKCPDCQSEILQKNLPEHQLQCSMILTTCADCNIVYKQKGDPQHHSDIICLREQLLQLRYESQNEIRNLQEQIHESRNDQIRLLASIDIIVDNNDRRTKRTYIKSTVDIGILDRNRIVLDSESHSSLSDTTFCSKCANILWKPVSCRNCGFNCCEKCGPSTDIFSKIMFAFNRRRAKHGVNNCENFKTTEVSHQVAGDLATIRVRCIYAPNGCRMILSYYDLEDHEKVCEFENVPCELCQLTLSKRQPIAQHTQRACFERMHQKNPSGIQQQFMILLNSMEQIKTANNNLQQTIETLKAELKDLNSVCVKKVDTNIK